MKKSLITLAIIASLTTLTGCGSSSSSGPDVPSSTTLSGTAAKGIIQQGIVTATELAADGIEIGVVGTAITDDSGRYTLELTDAYQDGVVRLTISAGENTTMKCDATTGCGTDNDFGSSVDLEDGFSLDAIVKPEGTNVSVQITPLTHMAAARALVAAETGELNADSVADAISEVNQIAGVNIMSTEVVDITDATALVSASDEAKQLALFNTGLADILVAGEGTLQENLIANIDDLAASFEDGEFASDDAITITDITDAVTTAVTNVSGNSDIAAVLEDSIASVETNIDVIESQVGEDGGFDPEPSDSAGSDEITQAKALITEARTFIEKIDSDFTDPLDALSIDAQTVSDALDADSVVMAELLGATLEQTLTYLDGQNVDILAEIESPTAGGYITPITDELGTSIGTMTTTFSSDASGVSITLNGSLTGNGGLVDNNGDALEAKTVNVTNLKLATNLTVEDLTTSTDIETQETLLDAITATSVQLKLTGFVGNETTSLTLTDVSLMLSATEEVTLDTTEQADNSALESKISGASFSGDITIASNGASFAGNVEIVLVGLTNSAAEVPLSLQTLEVNGEFSSATEGSFNAGAKLTIDNASSFDTFGYLEQASTAYKWVSFDYNLSSSDLAIVNGVTDTFDFTSVPAISSALWMDIYYYNSQYEIWAGDDANYENKFFTTVLTDLNTEILSNTAEQLSDATDATYQIEHISYHYPATSVEADVKVSFPDFETADNFVQGTLMVMAQANVPELPEATVVASVSRTELAGGDASIAVSYDGQSFTLAVDSEDLDADEPEATMTLTNPDGVKLIVNLAETLAGDQYVVSGTVSVGGTQVGTVEETSNGLVLVRYNDGTFESLY